MRRARHLVAVITLGLSSYGLVWAQGGNSADAPIPFPLATLHLE